MKPIFGVILVVLNILALAGVGGVFYYTRHIYHRPKIVETKEREKLEQAKPVAVTGTVSYVKFEPITVNIKPESDPDEQGLQRLHYAQVEMTFEILDSDRASDLELHKTQIIDYVIEQMGGRTFDELNTVQGRYVFRNDLIEHINEILESPLIGNVHLSKFLIQ